MPQKRKEVSDHRRKNSRKDNTIFSSPITVQNTELYLHMLERHHITTSVSGHYLIRKPSCNGPFRLLVGFHGYGQLAEAELALLQQIEGNGDWICCAIEALHPFYAKKGGIGASWMTRHHREIMITENIDYIDKVLSELGRQYPLDGTLVYHGFSMGAAMAVHSALLGQHSPKAVMLLGGAIPREHERLEKMNTVHIARGNSDFLYKKKEYERDMAKLEASGVPFVQCSFSGGHEAGETYLKSAGAFLKQVGN